LHYFLYFLLFSSHSTRNIPKLALFFILFLYFLHFSSHSTRNIQKNCIIFFIFHRIQQETFKKLHYFLYFLHFSSHSTRNIQKITCFPLFSSFFIAFNKKHSKKCIIFFIFHRIQQETFKKLHYFLYFLHFSSHSTRNITKKLHYFLYFLHFSSRSTRNI
jgi:hypothetical protein